MKVKIEIECTPLEARSFLGLPDVTLLNDHFVAHMKQQMDENIHQLKPEELFKTWTQFGSMAQDQFFKIMQAAAQSNLGGRSSSSDS